MPTIFCYREKFVKNYFIVTGIVSTQGNFFWFSIVEMCESCKFLLKLYNIYLLNVLTFELE